MPSIILNLVLIGPLKREPTGIHSSFLGASFTNTIQLISHLIQLTRLFTFSLDRTKTPLSILPFLILEPFKLR